MSFIIDHAKLEQRFTIVDYAVFGFMLGLSALIGLYYALSGGRQSTTSEFLMGNRSLKVFPVAMSLMASFVSAIGLLGLPSETYMFGLQNWAHIFPLPIVIAITAHVFIPVFYNLQITSVYEYLEMRFDRSARLLGSVLFIISMEFFMAIVLYAPALAISQVTGLNVWFSVLSTGIVCAFYTTIGGVKAVIWTNVFQTFMMIVMMFVIVIKGIIDSGGIANIIEINEKYQRIEIFDMDPNPFVRQTFWTAFFGGIFHWLNIYCFNQAMVQRYLSVPSLKHAQKTVWVVLPFKIVLLSFCCFMGLIVFGRYHDCDPLSIQRVKAPDQLFPLFVMDTLGSIPGFPGLFVAGVFSGSLSTVSSGVNALAAVTLEDFVKPNTKKELSDARATLITKLMALAYGALSIIIVVLAQHLGNLLQASLSIFGLTASPIFGLFILGMFFPKAKPKAAFWGTIIGLIISLWIGIGAMYYKPFNPTKPMSVDGCVDTYVNITQNFNYSPETFETETIEKLSKNSEIPLIYQISYQYYGIIGAALTILIGRVLSYFEGDSSFDGDSRLLVSISVKLGKTMNEIPKKQSYINAHSNKEYAHKDTDNDCMIELMGNNYSNGVQKENNN